MLGHAASAVFTGAAVAPNLVPPTILTRSAALLRLLCDVTERVWGKLGSGEAGREITLSKYKTQFRFIAINT